MEGPVLELEFGLLGHRDFLLIDLVHLAIVLDKLFDVFSVVSYHEGIPNVARDPVLFSTFKVVVDLVLVDTQLRRECFLLVL